MKNVLIASTALVAFAGAAFADGHASPLTLSGSADFGVATVSQAGNTDSYFIHDFDISWAANGTTDAGLQFGASGQLDDDATPTVYLAGSWGRIEFGDADDGMDAALPGVSTAGLEDNPGGSGAYGVAAGASIGDYDRTDTGIGSDEVLYTSPTFGGATFYASYGIQGQSTNANDTGAVGIRYVVGGWTIGAGYAEAGTRDAYGIGVSGSIGPANVALQYREQEDTGTANDQEDIDVSVTFAAGAGTVGAMANFSERQTAAGVSQDVDAFGVWYNMPLGGGATLNVAAGTQEVFVGGVSQDRDEFGVGVSMSF